MYRREMCPREDVESNEAELFKILKKVGSGNRKSKGFHVANLLGGVYQDHNILLGDVHFGNVGLRSHSLKPWGVPRHKGLVVTDLGDLGQAPRVRGTYPAIKTVNPHLMQRYASAIPVLPCR